MFTQGQHICQDRPKFSYNIVSMRQKSVQYVVLFATASNTR